MQGASDKFVSCPKRISCWPQAIGQTLLSSPGNYSEHPSNHIAILISWICINCYVFLCSRKVPEYYFGIYLLICFRSTVFIISLCYSELMQPSQVGLLKGKKCTYISQSPVNFEVGEKTCVFKCHPTSISSAAQMSLAFFSVQKAFDEEKKKSLICCLAVFILWCGTRHWNVTSAPQSRNHNVLPRCMLGLWNHDGHVAYMTFLTQMPYYNV